MNVYFVSANDFKPFISRLISAKRVIGPTAKRGRFAFERLTSAEELRLDYDVTILPPKKLFFPPVQDLIRFEGDRYEGCVDPQEQVLFGVHFYDVKAVDMTDLLFRDRHADCNYLAYREATTIVASNIQRVSERAFWASIGTDVPPAGHDAFLTKIDKGFVFETRTPKGAELLEFGRFRKAEKTEIAAAAKANEQVLKKCPEQLRHKADAVAKKLWAVFGDEALWERLAQDCFSCGSCNVVCPTCYCFDVQDHWNLDQRSGGRTRYWDACLTEEFAKVSLGAGAAENFRESRGERFRHRFMRKAAYLNKKLGGPACVGCGRCSVACTAGIAGPPAVIDQVMER
jgi:sulfhydrogenase subunit beta (sulfur reductase)